MTQSPVVLRLARLRSSSLARCRHVVDVVLDCAHTLRVGLGPPSSLLLLRDDFFVFSSYESEAPLLLPPLDEEAPDRLLYEEPPPELDHWPSSSPLEDDAAELDESFFLFL